MEEINVYDLEDGQAESSASGESVPEKAQTLSTSQSQKLLIRPAFKLPLEEILEVLYSSRGSFHPPQSRQAFLLHLLLDQVEYSDWDHPNRIFGPPKRFSFLYPENFWGKELSAAC